MAKFNDRCFCYFTAAMLVSTLDGVSVQSSIAGFQLSVIKPKNRNHSINKVTNKGYDR